MIYAAAGQPIVPVPAVAGAFPPGLLGTITLELYSPSTGLPARAESPDGITEPRAGTYRAPDPLVAPADEGLYALRWAAMVDGELVVAEDDLIVTATGVEPAPPVTGALASAEDLRLYLHTAGTVGPGATVDDRLLELMLAGATTRMAEAVPERTLAPTPAALGEPVAVTFQMRGQSVLQVPDLRDLTAAAIDGRELDVTRIRLARRPREVCALWARFDTYLTGELVLTGRWGPAGARLGDPLDVRADVRDACLVWAARAYYNRAARFADNAADAAGAPLGYFRNLPPDVKVVLDSLAIPGV